MPFIQVELNGQVVAEGEPDKIDEIVFEGDAGIEALDREKARAAHEDILQQYAISRDRNL